MFFNLFKKKSKQKPTRWHFPLTEFIAVLKNEKFSIAVDTHILMHTIIQQFDLPEQLEQLPAYLSPIVAQSAKEQERFCDYFKRWFFVEKFQEKTNKKTQKRLSEINKNQAEESPEKLNGSSQKEENTEKQKAVLNIEQGMLPNKGLSFAVRPVKVEFNSDTLRQFRQWRFMRETQKTFFDINATIKKTAQKGEIAEPVYKHARQHTEYLIISEQNTYKNHHARFVKSIYKTLISNNIDVLLFTYNTDPRILYSAKNNKKYTINQVFALYSKAVLLYFGSPSLWFNTQNLQIFSWTKILKRWQLRYWFPINSPDNWHLFEQAGNKIFPNILPFDFTALQVLGKHLTNNYNSNKLSLEFWKQNTDYSLSDINTELPLETIALFFEPQMRKWIAACAVYPEISWEMTLALGKFLSNKNKNLCAAENVLQLLRLDWFRLGYIPPQMRFALIEKWLTLEDNRLINEHIAELMMADIRLDILKKLPVFRMQLAIHKLIAETKPEKREQIAKELKNEIQNSKTADFVALQYINEAELSPVFFVLPDNLVASFEKIIGKPLKTKKQNTTSPANYTETAAGVGIDMIYIKGGTFTMGSPKNEKERYDNEYQHQVTVSDFYIGKYQVTQKQWREVMGYNPSSFKGDNLPVEKVSWNDVQEFIKKLNAKTGQTYRLPTEAEWEYACRAGSTTPFNTGNCLSTEQANYNGNYPYTNCSKGKYRGKTTAVGSFSPNAWGIYDMHGNVWEWCNDWYDSDYYKNSPKNNPQGPSSGSYRVLRGGSWDYDAGNCRSANRSYDAPVKRYSNIGFRLVRAVSL